MIINKELEMKVFQDDKAETEDSKKNIQIDYIFFQFTLDIPLLIDVNCPELSDDEILELAVKTGTFVFLDDPEEDIYNLSDCIPYE